MRLNVLRAIIKRAARNLGQNQPNLYDFTSVTNQTEWNLAHHLANELREFFPRHDCDLDVSKANVHYHRPDIIIHHRGEHLRNFLVVEVKRDTSGVLDDINKIMGFWFEPPLSYDFGAVVVLDKDLIPVVEVFRNAKKVRAQ